MAPNRYALVRTERLNKINARRDQYRRARQEPSDFEKAVMATVATLGVPFSKTARAYALHARSDIPSLAQAAKSYLYRPNTSKRIQLTAPTKQLGYGPMSRMAVRGRTKYRAQDTAHLAGKYRKLKRKPLKKKAKRKMRKFDTLGVRDNFEEGADVSDSKIIYIGQALSVRRLIKVFCQGLYRAIMKKANHDFQSWSETIQDPVDTAQPLFAVFYTSDVGVGLSQTKGITSHATHAEMCDQFTTWFNDYFIDNQVIGGSFWQNGYRMQKIVFKLGQDKVTPGFYVDSFELPLQGAVARFNYTQSMKVQNVSLAADGGADADQDSDVFNVPLNGRIYEANGNGLRFKYPGFTMLKPNLGIGLGSNIIKATSSNAVPSEPPEAYEFENVKRYEKISMNPGKIKTSVVSKAFSCGIDKFMDHLIFAVRTPLSVNKSQPFGKARVMCLEKVIGNITGTEQPIRVRCEVDTKLQCYLHTKNRVFLCPDNYTI